MTSVMKILQELWETKNIVLSYSKIVKIVDAKPVTVKMYFVFVCNEVHL